jgi:hypothetical protein
LKTSQSGVPDSPGLQRKFPLFPIHRFSGGIFAEISVNLESFNRCSFEHILFVIIFCAFQSKGCLWFPDPARLDIVQQ